MIVSGVMATKLVAATPNDTLSHAANLLRQHQLHPLTLAHTHGGEIVGQVTSAPGSDWWEGFENVYEVTIEVSSNWRGSGIGRHLWILPLNLMHWKT